MNNRWTFLKYSLLAVTALAIGSTGLSAAPYLKTPQPGEVYKEFTRMNNSSAWRVTDPDASNPGSPGNSPCDFMSCDASCDNCSNPALALSITDLTSAVRAEALIDVWGGHIGTSLKQFRVNGNAWINIADLATTPSSPECYVHQFNAVVDVPLANLVVGTNQFQGLADRQVCFNFNWGQWGWMSITMRVYYNPATKAHPTGSITSPTPGSSFGEDPVVTATATGAGGIARVDFIARYDGDDPDGDGRYNDWHESYHRAKVDTTVFPRHHVGTDTTASGSTYSVTWDTRHVPDQAGPTIGLQARILDNSGVFFVTPVVDNLALVRNTERVEFYKPFNVPQSYWIKSGSTPRSSKVFIPTDKNLANAIEAFIFLPSWNGINGEAELGEAWEGKFNNHILSSSVTGAKFGANHYYQYDIIQVPVAALTLGDNTFTWANNTVHHGWEILWPGPGLMVRWTKAPDNCGDGNLQGGQGEECDDGNTQNGDGCNAFCISEYCGDGLLHAGLGEECDDGNTVSGDGCRSDCTEEVCGDGFKESGEECDDGNIVNGDGCSSECNVEYCGDGVRQGQEQCDDGDADERDGCRSNCRFADLVAYGFEEPSGSTVIDVTGNGYNGTMTGGAARTNLGKLGKAMEFNGTAGRVSMGTYDVAPGTGLTIMAHINADSFTVADARIVSKAFGLNDPEHLWMVSMINGNDLRFRLNTSSGGTTSLSASTANLVAGQWYHVMAVWTGSQMQVWKDCQLLTSVSKSGVLAVDPAVQTWIGDQPPSGTKSFDGRIDEFRILNRAVGQAECEQARITPLDLCGDGVQHPGEDCDDGNGVPGDGCTPECRLEICGNGTVDPNEDCDQGFDNSDTLPDRCRLDCTEPGCGDGVADTGEQCDDGNTAPGDGCRPTCVAEVCGDGVLDAPGEQCDNGAANSNTAPNACRTDCDLAGCGDGVIDSGEQCDDSNVVNADGCQANCQIPFCGDGVKDGSEQCDDGNQVNGDGCNATCLFGFCGDGLQDPGEDCDTGANNSDSVSGACRTDCSAPACGDGVVDPGEACDDGNLVSGDLCRSNCKHEVCGDAVADPGEQCDDGNQASGDGCKPDCTAEVCGDGLLQAPGEQCDNGGANSNVTPNACRTNCTAARCGDGVVDSGEFCDDGNQIPGDGCNPSCTQETCGDGHVDPGEECDDGNAAAGDGCTPTCLADPITLHVDRGPDDEDALLQWNGGSPTYSILRSIGNRQSLMRWATSPSTSYLDSPGSPVGTVIYYNVVLRCGDGVLDGGEVCDDGNNLSGDGCQANCLDPFCGDGAKDPGEQCDDGNVVDNDGCSTQCLLPSCGDGYVIGSEECDDGNTASGDGCRADCSDEICGDGYLDAPGEECDRGAANSDSAPNGCRTDCTLAGCGDGVVDQPMQFLLDGGFDNWGGSVLNDWLRSTAGGTIVQNTTVEFSGTSAVQMNRIVPGTLRVHQNFMGLEPGREYELRVWARVNPGVSTVDVPLIVIQNFSKATWLQENGIWGTAQNNGSKRGGLTAAGQWQLFTVRFTTRLNDSAADVYKLSLWHGNNFDTAVQVLYDASTILGPLDGVTLEECDDGNPDSGDGCSAQCQIEACGNGRLDAGEQCDDGNAVPGDGCTAACIVEFCGDGVLQAGLGEQCDNGGANSNTQPNACRTTCRPAACGDGVTDSGESCDDGNLIPGDGCNATCQPEFCGDGAVQAGLGEQCDDGAANSDVIPNACRTDCDLPSCGDAIVDTGEECDDGNTVSGDGCQSDCDLSSCGDGVLDGDEQCDDGNTSSGDGCSSACARLFSDDFNTCDLRSEWFFVDPLGDNSYSLVGVGTGNAHAVINVRAGVNHDSWVTNDAPRLMQFIDDSNFQVQTKLVNPLTGKSQFQGIQIERDNNHRMRFDFVSTGTKVNAFAASIVNGTPETHINTLAFNGDSPANLHLRVTRSGDVWTFEYSTNGSSWTLVGSFFHAIDVNALGIYGGNFDNTSPPALDATFDFLFNTLSPINPEDGGAPGPGRTLTVNTNGSGSVTVSPLQTQYFCSDEVSLTAVPAAGWLFDGWSGDLSGGDNPETIVMNSNKNVTANFEPALGPPVISNVQVELFDNRVTITWNTNEPASSRVDYGTTAAYGDFEASATLVTNHSVTIFGLSPETLYHFQLTSTDGDTETATTNDATFTTLAFIPGPFMSDDFDRCSMSSAWTFINPLNDGSATIVGAGTGEAKLRLSVPGGVVHDVWTSNDAPRLMQPSEDEDFQIEVKFASQLAEGNQFHGVIVQQDANDFLRFDLVSTGTQVRAFAASIVNGTPTAQISQSVFAGDSPTPHWIRVTRSGDAFTLEYSFDGANYLPAPVILGGFSFNRDLTVTEVGVFAGNAGAPAPAFVSDVDYFFDALAPIVPEDDGVGNPGRTLTVNTTGSGSVAKSPNQPLYYCNDVVTLTATPAGGSVFTGWSQDLTGIVNPKTIAVDANRQVTAAFAIDTIPPIIADVTVEVEDTSAVVCWNTNEASTSVVDYGLTAGYGQSVSNGLFVTRHCVTITGLTPDETYHFRVTSVDNELLSSSSSDATFTTLLFPPGAFDSDDFNSCAVDSMWEKIHPLGDTSISIVNAGTANAQLRISIPAGTSHDAWTSNNAPRAMQACDDEDFVAVAKFESTLSTSRQFEGIIVEQDANDWIRFDLVHNGTSLSAFAAVIDDGAPVTLINSTISSGPLTTAHWVRVTRTGDQFKFEYSFNGSSWTTAGFVNHVLTVSKIGPFAGTAVGNPAFVSLVDYFFDAQNPIVPEDGGVAPDGLVLTVNIQGGGSVTRVPNQSFYCSTSQVVTLQAVASPLWTFSHWTGALTGSTNPQNVTMTTSKTVTAVFVGPPNCGNGTFEPGLGEQCDDGNTTSGDGCSGVCIIEGCGNGVIEPGEECDDGDATSSDGCSAACVVEFCGDGLIQTGLGEVCDQGAGNSDILANACRTDCQPAACGDSVVDSGEQCDDGNTTSGDGCQASCLLPSNIGVLAYGFEEASGSNVVDVSGHGNNGTIQGGATRIAGGKIGKGVTFGTTGAVNLNNLDLPYNQMTFMGWVNFSSLLPTDARIVSKATGNDPEQHWWMVSLLSNELRFRLRTNNGGGAPSTATLVSTGAAMATSTWTHVMATYDGSTLRIYKDCVLLGSMAKTGTIQVDNTVGALLGNQPITGPKTLNGVLDEVRLYSTAIGAAQCTVLKDVPAACGNGVQEGTEQCDDGNVSSGDGCTVACVSEYACGNGTPEPGEECDLGAGNSNAPNATCRTDCSLAGCGDNVVDSGEQCDLGVFNSDAPNADCRTDCTVAGCGDGIQDAGEACDEGAGNSNAPNADCRLDCEAGGCGDGVIDSGEQCDDDNNVGGDNCDPNCINEVCGNGVVQDGEDCDDGNLTNGDGCDSTCSEEACGNGTLQAGEQCDDGNATNGDGCDANCHNEVCGNGFLQSGEQCDDGNLTNGDTCDSNCRNEVCGNGFLQSGEQCDDGNLTNGDDCDSNCLDEVCGNGVTQSGEDCDAAGETALCDVDCSFAECGDSFVNETAGEACDSGGDSEVCDADCTLVTCGDGSVNEVAGEACDDGDTSGGDGCSGACAIEAGWQCSGEPSACSEDCGDNQIDPGETCDDGNLANGDGCDSNCISEVCGNGILQAGEQCDDSNTTNLDGCDSNCDFEVCGNGILQVGEGCDDGNNDPGDGCDADCDIEDCGNGEVQYGEECDDGNTVALDGCDANCLLECGNGTTAGTEQCDDGNVTNGDGCDEDCKSEICGNGIVQAIEQCDDSNVANGDGCDSNCKIEVCGNGIVQTGEECDDGNTSAGDGCSATCQQECGNTVVDPGETCDDGNFFPFDGCDENCQTEVCGNGLVQAAEDCDDGNLTNGDGCDANCVDEVCGNGVVQAGESCDTSGQSATCDGDCTAPACGDGVFNAAFGEACDTGGQSATCDADCSLALCGDSTHNSSAGEACDEGGETAACDADCTARACGDGVINEPGGEACDDGDTGSGDGCSSTCQVEANWTCNGEPSSCASNCGNGNVDGGEECDDGNASNTDACLDTCETASCGDGFVRAGVEECDDANAVNTDACLDTCETASCGDGFVRAGVEDCDDANTDNTDACLDTCETASCGDGFTQTGFETCDDGNLDNTDGCAACAPAVCGDGFVRAGVEDCDDANAVNTDACLDTCEVASCGDGFVQTGFEGCDEGLANSENPNATCRTDCQLAGCGDGVLDNGEECDDGNAVEGDGCSVDCDAITSDEFNAGALDTTVWTKEDPVGAGAAVDAQFNMTGSQIEIVVPNDTQHDAWCGAHVVSNPTNHDAPRVLQDAYNGDFTIEVKIDSSLTTTPAGATRGTQFQGILIEQTSNRFLRFDTYSVNGNWFLHMGNVNCGVTAPTSPINAPGGATPSTAPIWLQVKRVGDTWTLSYSAGPLQPVVPGDWTPVGSTSVPITVNRVGVFAGNSSGFKPAHTARFDHFRKTGP